jgi:hypothetical protein
VQYLQMFESNVLSKIFGCENDEVIGNGEC